VSWALLRRYWKVAAGAALLAALLWALHSYGQRRYEAGKDYVQAQWDADELLENQKAAAQLASNQAAEAAAATLNEEQVRESKQKAAAALADRDRIYRLLVQARDSARGGSAETAGRGAGASGASPDGRTAEADADAGIDQQIAAVIAERRANDAQLDALIAVIKPQLSP
jgi:hypothetical protein